MMTNYSYSYTVQYNNNTSASALSLLQTLLYSSLLANIVCAGIPKADVGVGDRVYSTLQTVVTRIVCVCVRVYLLNCTVCVCVVIPFILDVRLVDVPAGITQQ